MLVEADVADLLDRGLDGGADPDRSEDLVGDGFALALIALNTLMLLGDRTGQAAAVRVLADHLAPGGIAVVDVWLPDADDLARYDGRLILEYARDDPETGRTVVKTGAATHDAATQTVTLTTIFDEGASGSSRRSAGSAATASDSSAPTSCAASPRRPDSSSRRLPAATTWSRSDRAPTGPSSSPCGRDRAPATAGAGSSRSTSAPSRVRRSSSSTGSPRACAALAEWPDTRPTVEAWVPGGDGPRPAHGPSR